LISVAGVATLAPSFDTVDILVNTGDVLERVMRVLLAEDKEKHNNSLSLCFLADVFQMCDKNILETITPVLTEISHHNTVEHLKLSMITDEHVNCE